MPVLQFKGRTAIESYHRVVPHHTLEIDKKLSLSKKPGLDGNLIIEGDNLLALKSLMPTHAGRIKCIYIDPPYNTGNEGWVYNDNLTQPQFKEWIGKTVGKEGEDACRHDKWCCMMFPRLQLLRELLTDDGIIFVSIDDNEQASLRLLMDEVFGLENFIGCIAWKTRNTDNRVKTMLSVDHEFVVAYSMNRAPLRGRKIDRSSFENPDKDPNGPYVTDPLLGYATAKERPNPHYVMEHPKSGVRFPPDPSRGWRIEKKSFLELVKQNRIWWPPDPKTGNPRKRRYLSETSERMPASSFWADIKGQSGADEVDQILGKRLFAFPKSVDFMDAVIDLISGPDDIVLDATAGTGTTAHAVMRANKEDGGTQCFVLIQMPFETLEQRKDDFNICRRITRERVKRVIEGYTYTDAKGRKVKVPGLGGEFTYARVGRPLFDEYRNLGKERASYEEMARYIWFTETSRPFDAKQVDRKARKIGEHQDASYYLLYEPGDKEAPALDLEFLKNLKDKNRRKVVYCEKIWAHRDELARFGDVRPMVVPFTLK